MKRIFIFTLSLLCLSKIYSQKNAAEISAQKTESQKIETQKVVEENPHAKDVDNAKDDIQTKDVFHTKDDVQTKDVSHTKGDAQTKDVVHERRQVPLASDEILARADIDNFRKQYLSEKWSTLLYDYLESAMEYRLYVRKAVEDQNLPAIIEYLPIVESNYKTTAKSKSGAIGMWQFMANSVSPFLTLNDFVDERLDPWKSTDAALKKLQDNYNYFGDWLIAIAAYNCGAGAMTAAIKKAGNKDFWYLADKGYLSPQTALYVPKLLAIADISINSEYYEIDLPDHAQEFKTLENEKNGHFDYITVQKAYSLAQLAQEMRIDSKTLKHFNPSYTLGMTHPVKQSRIRLPLGMQETAIQALDKLTPIKFPLQYKVAAGDSLWSISRKYGTTVAALCDLNNIKENAILKIGKTLYIPSK